MMFIFTKIIYFNIVLSTNGSCFFKCNILYKSNIVPFINLYLCVYFLLFIIKVSFLVFQLGVYNSFGKRDLVVTTQKKGKEI